MIISCGIPFASFRPFHFFHNSSYFPPPSLTFKNSYSLIILSHTQMYIIVNVFISMWFEVTCFPMAVPSISMLFIPPPLPFSVEYLSYSSPVLCLTTIFPIPAFTDLCLTNPFLYFFSDPCFFLVLWFFFFNDFYGYLKLKTQI